MSLQSEKKYQVRITPSLLTIVIFPDDSRSGAKCLELDLVSEDDTPDKVLKAMVEMIQEYAMDYTNRFETFSESPNRAHHQPYVQRISECKTDWEVLEFSEVKYGSFHL